MTHANGHVVASHQFVNERCRDAAARVSDERIELAPNEVPAVQRGELEKLRFPVGVAEVLERSAHEITLTRATRSIRLARNRCSRSDNTWRWVACVENRLAETTRTAAPVRVAHRQTHLAEMPVECL